MLCSPRFISYSMKFKLPYFFIALKVYNSFSFTKHKSERTVSDIIDRFESFAARSMKLMNIFCFIIALRRTERPLK